MNNKERLLYVQEILQKETDEENELTLEQIMTKLHAVKGTEVNKKTLRDDLNALKDSGLFPISVNQEKNGVEKTYQHRTKLFTIQELRLLADALTTASFISKEETEQMINKLKKLTSHRLADHLDNRLLVPPDRGNREVQELIKTVHLLHDVIKHGDVIRYQYGQYNLTKEFTLRENGRFYTLKSYALIWDDQRYYLIGEDEDEDLIRYERVDQMYHVERTGAFFTWPEKFDLMEWLRTHSSVMTEQKEDLQLECHLDSLQDVLDCFGLDVTIQSLTDERFLLATKAVIDKGLMDWLFSLGGKVKVIHPPKLAEEIQREATAIIDQYRLANS
ncbi:helix-turn-helix transcriptional regulator [Halalkalibacterium halodurans]|uniref:WCX domain-containing protein n=1 Tax=Halalkalibacterium halodurans TaxID=86665 RepID=A0A0M0KKB2_ALKHA|nr:WYL domain-containing protein [Halalkalibacterium halodurans]MDY7222375.1 WYL domain-containing protein [Halalkalibacterium halodurans]MDY7241596.1 WYL domain-containing protein [Halalkalibacterium halodurans]TPE70932.1 WYL domain-containing protein [Halalkalibacterium halodurans]